MQKPADVWMPALAAGAIFGFLSGLPLVGALNCACCSLIVGGGVLAAYQVVRASIEPVTYGRAALAGILSGVIAAPVSSLMDALFRIILGRVISEQIGDMAEQLSQISPEAAEMTRALTEGSGLFLFLASTLLYLLVFPGFGALGGVIGRAIFEKRTPAPPAAVPGPGAIGPPPPAAQP